MRMFVNTEEDIPWDAMQYMLGQINYGGRVTDDWDRTCLMCILKSFIGDHVINDEKVRFSQSGIYFLPQDGLLEDYRKYIE
jgi:dynein heavy chain